MTDSKSVIFIEILSSNYYWKFYIEPPRGAGNSEFRATVASFHHTTLLHRPPAATRCLPLSRLHHQVHLYASTCVGKDKECGQSYGVLWFLTWINVFGATSGSAEFRVYCLSFYDMNIKMGVLLSAKGRGILPINHQSIIHLVNQSRTRNASNK